MYYSSHVLFIWYCIYYNKDLQLFFHYQNLWFLLDKHHTPPVIGDDQVLDFEVLCNLRWFNSLSHITWIHSLWPILIFLLTDLIMSWPYYAFPSAMCTWKISKSTIKRIVDGMMFICTLICCRQSARLSAEQWKLIID